MGWLDKKELFNKKFENFVEKKETEDRKREVGKFPRFSIGKKDRGTFEVRFLPDPNLNFYKEIFYHLWQKEDGGFQFVPCAKTHGPDVFCPWCRVSYSLYKSSSDRDKEEAKNYKRKNKFVGNILVVDDPRDSEVEKDDDKNTGKNRIYEFPSTVESKIKNELKDRKNGLGPAVFDPENGHNFILKVESKGEWPNYENSMFARKPSAVGSTPEEVEQIMDGTFDLDEVIADIENEFTPQKHIEILKDTMMIDISGVREEIKKYWDIDIEGGEEPNLDELNQGKKESVKKETEEVTSKMDTLPWDDEEEKKDEEDFSLEEKDILAELESLANS